MGFFQLSMVTTYMRITPLSLASLVFLSACSAPTGPDSTQPTPLSEQQSDEERADAPAVATPESDPSAGAESLDLQSVLGKLDPRDRDALKAAVLKLRGMVDKPGIEAAIPVLAAIWERQGRVPLVLSTVVELAERGAGGPHWEAAVPVLHTALVAFDPGDRKLVESAVIAGDALGKAGRAESIPLLIRVLETPMPRMSEGQRARIAAVRALGSFTEDARAVAAVLAVLSHRHQRRPILLGAAARVMADMRSPDAVEPLLLGMFASLIYSEFRRALVSIGEPAQRRILAVFEGRDQVLNAFARANQFNVDCKRAMGKKTACRAPGKLRYRSALLLGDMRSKLAVKALLAELDKPAVTADFEFYRNGPTQHAAVLSALGRIGDPAAARRVWRYASRRKRDPELRAQALDTYSVLARGTDKLRALARIVKDDNEDEKVRLAAGVAYGRLVRDEKSYRPLLYMIERYRKKADKYAREGVGLQAKIAQAESDLDDKRQRGAEAREIADAAKRLELAQKRAAATYSQEFEYRDYQRKFETNLARAYVGVTCQRDVSCYTRMLMRNEDQVRAGIARYLVDWDSWDFWNKFLMWNGAINRALLELGKLGPEARAAMPTLLKLAASTDQEVRVGTHDALAHVAPLPCTQCVKRFDEILETQKDERGIQDQELETEVIRGYFLWAGH